jgi:hypothetical protein
MQPAEQVIADIAKAQSPEQRLAVAEKRIKHLEAEILEYIRVEAVLIAARKLNQDTVAQAHELVRNCS